MTNIINCPACNSEVILNLGTIETHWRKTDSKEIVRCYGSGRFIGDNHGKVKSTENGELHEKDDKYMGKE